jgi:hypothetical protein
LTPVRRSIFFGFNPDLPILPRSFFYVTFKRKRSCNKQSNL